MVLMLKDHPHVHKRLLFIDSTRAGLYGYRATEQTAGSSARAEEAPSETSAFGV